MERLYDIPRQTCVGERWHHCPEDVDVTTVQSYLSQRLGDPLRIAMTSTPDDAESVTGWVCQAPDDWPVDGDRTHDALAAIPVVCHPDLPWTPAFPFQREERRRFDALAKAYGTELQVEHVPQTAWTPYRGASPG